MTIQILKMQEVLDPEVELMKFSSKFLSSTKKILPLHLVSETHFVFNYAYLLTYFFFESIRLSPEGPKGALAYEADLLTVLSSLMLVSSTYFNVFAFLLTFSLSVNGTKKKG